MCNHSLARPITSRFQQTQTFFLHWLTSAGKNDLRQSLQQITNNVLIFSISIQTGVCNAAPPRYMLLVKLCTDWTSDWTDWSHMYHDCMWQNWHVKTKCIGHRAWVRTQTLPLDLVGFHLRPQKAAVDLIQQEHSIDSILSFLRFGFCCTLAPPGTNSFQTCFKHGFVALLSPCSVEKSISIYSIYMFSFGARHWLVNFTNAFGFKGREFGPWVRGGNGVLSLCRGRVRCAPDEKLVARCDTTFCRSCCHVISYVLRLVTKLNWF